MHWQNWQIYSLFPGHHTSLHIGRPLEMTVEAAMEVILAAMGTPQAANSW
jgi:hypothetical protein